MSDKATRILIERLRRESLASRPAFSESLHARVCGALAAVPADDPLKRALQKGPGAVAARLVWLAAAALLLAALPLAWRAAQGPPAAPPPEQLATQDDVPPPMPNTAGTETGDIEAVAELADKAVEQIQTLVASTVTDGQWAYLDHDAQLAVETLVDGLPIDLSAALAVASGPQE